MPIRIQTKLGVDLLHDPIDVGGGQIDFIDHRDDRQVVFHGQVEIGKGLGLDALGGVDEQQNPFTRGEGPGDLIGKIHMTGGIDQVEDILFPIVGAVGEGNGLALDGDAPLPLDVHVVQDLVLEIAIVHHAGVLDQAVRQRRFAMVDVGDNAEVADVFHKNR